MVYVIKNKYVDINFLIPSHYMNKFSLTVNWSHTNKLLWINMTKIVRKCIWKCSCLNVSSWCHLWPCLLTWINCNPSMDNQLHYKEWDGSTCTFSNFNGASIFWLNIVHVSERDPMYWICWSVISTQTDEHEGKISWKSTPTNSITHKYAKGIFVLVIP